MVSHGQALQELLPALDRARAGEPVVAFIEGEPGVGKSFLADELIRRAEGFRVLATEAYDGDLTPMSSLGGWAVPAGATAGGGVPAEAAAEAIRQVLERDAAGAPVVLRLDDLHWADRESVEGIVMLMQRAVGERLMVLITSRPLGNAHPGWRRWSSRAPQVMRVMLRGVSLTEAEGIAAALRPGVSTALVKELWEYTAANPLFLTSLLVAHDAGTLMRSRVLPAPAQFAHVTVQRLSAISEPAVAMVRAVSVLGTGWVPVPDAGAVAGSAEPFDAVQELRDSGLLQVRDVDGLLEVRIDHALVRSAVYHDIPLAQRRQLHARAAGVVQRSEVALGHRAAAAAGHDRALADELSAQAWQRYERREFAVAAQLLRWAAALTDDPDKGEQLWLDSLFAGELVGDFDAVRLESAKLDRVSDRARRALVLAAVEIFQGRFTPGRDILRLAVQEADVGAVDPAVRYRLASCLAWSASASGADVTEIRAALDRADSIGVQDAATSAFVEFVRGGMRMRAIGLDAALAGMTMLPEDPADAPESLRYAVATRGTLRMMAGYYDGAIGDLSAALAAISAGRQWELTPGTIRTFLGRSYWMRGDWEMAALHFRMVSAPDGVLSTLMLTSLAAAAAARGDFPEADSLLDRYERALEGGSPWPENAKYLYVAKVIRLHAQGTPQERARLLPDLRARFPIAVQADGLVSSGWVLYAAQGAIWANELDEAQSLIEWLESGPRPTWTRPVAAWLHGLVAEQGGQHQRAVRWLRQAAETDGSLPFYRAHVLADAARVEGRWGDSARADQAAEEALRIYRRLGARPYLERPIRPPTSRPDPRQPAGPTAAATAGTATIVLLDGAGLTDREQDVLTLLRTGLSYDQIGKDLFITRSTVAYHVGNIYAKTGVTSRHELVALLRER